MDMRVLLLVVSMTVAANSLAAECTVRSGAGTAALLELYTSEGCDSCPPADRWLSTFLAGGKDSARVVPIAFHVDYWDYLGWKDRFGEARHSERQRRLARASGARAVYTPQVVVGGRDFQEWRGGNAAKEIGAVNAKPARVTLEITADTGASARVAATAAPGLRTDDLALLVAITQDGLVTEVKAGENRGATLRHDFVVRDLRSDRTWTAGDSPTLRTRVDFSPRADWNLGRMSFVAFVQDVRTGEILQALSAPTCVPR